MISPTAFALLTFLFLQMIPDVTNIYDNTTDISLFQQDLDSLFQWSIDNHLSFNSVKCISLRFKSRSNHHDVVTYSINNLTIFEKTHRDLDIMFSVTLQWRSHYENITAKGLQDVWLTIKNFQKLYIF